MGNFLNTLYGRISLIFLLLLLVLGVVQILLVLRISTDFVRETDQTLNLELAGDLAEEFEPLLRDSLDYDGLKHAIHDLMVINRHVEIYVLDPDGTLRAYFTEAENLKRMAVSVEPIEEFLAAGPDRTLPLYGDDPRQLTGQKTFSAAPTTIGGEGPGYVYVILGGQKYDSASAMIRESYIIRTSALVLGLVFVAAAVVGLILFALLTRRLRALTETVYAFEQGDFRRRAQVTSRDEIGQLARSFNAMADTIDAHVHQLQETDRLRRELIANVSHDLRNPLASVQGYLETLLIKDQDLDPEARQQYLTTILHRTESLSRLVGELFELSKLDAKQTVPEPEPFAIAELVQDIALSYEPRAREKGVLLETRVAERQPVVVADIAMIERVISNLIENAIRYTPDGGTVGISIDEDADLVHVHVSDTGCGIPPEDLPHVFDRFYRVEKSRSRESGGTGLGLAIVKTILAAHERDITVESVPDRGTTFIFDLPVYRPARA